VSLKPPRTPASIPPAEKSALPLPTIPSIAVLPFTNLSGDPQQEYFSDGISDDLISDLSRVPKLFVIARTSSSTYKGKAEKVQTIGRELGLNICLKVVHAERMDRSGSMFNWSTLLQVMKSGHNVTTDRCAIFSSCRMR
jgi:adenylate cyclase